MWTDERPAGLPRDVGTNSTGRRTRDAAESVGRVMDAEGRTRQHYNVTFALLAVAAVSYALLQSLVAPALPGIQHFLHVSFNSASWVLTAYLLSASIATPMIGRLGDMYGKERLTTMHSRSFHLATSTPLATVRCSSDLLVRGANGVG